MKERPILFSAPMVRAILEGRKTQTRRVINDQSVGERYCGPCEDGSVLLEWLGTPCCGSGVWDEPEYSAKVTSPYGKIGDRLWVRESHAIVPRTAYAMSDGVQQILRPDDDHDAAIYREGWGRSTGGFRWRPSIHMPRWASRILLEVVSVRVERLQDISEADAKSEGCDDRNSEAAKSVGWCERPQRAFHRLWEHINGPESWDANPWVWVVAFRRVIA